MPIDYSRGKIYKIVDNTNDKCYIGSTCEPTLAKRLSKHVDDYKRYLTQNFHYITSFEVLKNGDYNIVLIENYPCNSKDELFSRERYWTNAIDCVNKIKNQGLFITLGEVEYNKQYREKNNVRLKEQQKQCYYENKVERLKNVNDYRKSHKEIIEEKKRIYYINNKERLDQKNRGYYEINKEKLLEKFQCPCGGKYLKSTRDRHYRSLKHKNWLEIKNIISNHETLMTQINNLIDETNIFISSCNSFQLFIQHFYCV